MAILGQSGPFRVLLTASRLCSDREHIQSVWHLLHFGGLAGMGGLAVAVVDLIGISYGMDSRVFQPCIDVVGQACAGLARQIGGNGGVERNKAG